MATATTIKLTPSTHPVYPPTQPHDDKATNIAASHLLQFNHDKYHMFFNTSGFHNHIAHHLLTIYALGATPSQIQHAFDLNKEMQRPQYPVSESNVAAMSDPAQFPSFLGDEKYFHDWEAFFRQEINSNPNG